MDYKMYFTCVPGPIRSLDEAHQRAEELIKRGTHDKIYIAQIVEVVEKAAAPIKISRFIPDSSA